MLTVGGTSAMKISIDFQSILIEIPVISLAFQVWQINHARGNQ